MFCQLRWCGLGRVIPFRCSCSENKLLFTEGNKGVILCNIKPPKRSLLTLGLSLFKQNVHVVRTGLYCKGQARRSQYSCNSTQLVTLD